jgi:hypothetical protein
VGIFWIPGHAGIRGNEIADEFAREGSLYQFAGPQPAFRIFRKNKNEKMKCWLDNQHMTLRQCLTSTQRQACDMIWSPGLAVRTRQLSFSRIESRVVTDLLTGQNSRR